MSSELRIKELKHKRTIFRSQLTRFKTWLEANAIDTNTSELQTRLDKIQQQLREFESFHTELELLDDTTNQLETRLNIEDEASILTAHATEILSRTNNQASSHISHRDFYSLPPTESNCEIGNGVELPKIHLPTFSGSYEEWPGFADQFFSSVHDYPKINDTRKLTYLRSCLKGEAAKKIEHIPNTGINYAVAWEILQKRYDDPKLIVAKRLKAIFEASALSKTCPRQLHEFLNVTETNYRALKAIKQPSFDTVLIYSLQSRLDKETAQRWKERESKSDFPTVEEFFGLLNKRCKEIEPLGDDIASHSKTEKPNRVHKNISYNNTRQSPTQPKTAYAAQTIQSCYIFKNNHLTFSCPKLIQTAVKDRETFIKNHKLCINCLRPGHDVSICKSTHNCKTCSRRHHTLLHRPYVESQNTTQTACLQCKSSEQVVLATAVVDIIDTAGNKHPCRALLDSGSQSNFLAEEFVKKLNLRRNRMDVPVIGVGQATCRVFYSTDARMQSRFNAFNINTKFLVLPKLTETILPSQYVDRTNLCIPKNIKLADPQFHKPSPIDAILGAAIYQRLMSIGKIPLNNERASLCKTQLGWVLTGEVGSGIHSNAVTCNLSSRALEIDLAKFWELSDNTNNTHQSEEEKLCEEHYKNHTIRDYQTGRYIVKLPFKNNISPLGESYFVALKRFYALEKSLVKNKTLKLGYSDFLREYIGLGHMTETKTARMNEGYYLPHHAVLKHSSLTTKLRVVFDASAKTTSGNSLNEALMVGPVIQEYLIPLLIRFRSHACALTADIAKMYRQILVHPSDRRYEKILWREDPNEPIRTYELNTVTYGTSAASFLAIRSLHQLADDEKLKYPLAASVLKTDFYVDDLLTEADTHNNALKLRNELLDLLCKGGFQLRQWASNDPSLIMDLKDQSKDAQICLNLEDCTKTLGIRWHPRCDVISYTVNFKELTPRVTKRGILSEIAQLFDPLGLLGPTIVIGRLIIQRLWQLKCDWDESIPADLHSTWLHYRAQLPRLQTLQYPRKIISDNSVSVQLHGFCDASERAYGACMYTRCIDKEGRITINLICSRSRVAPLKSLTLPRLELCAALLLSNLFHITYQALKLTFEKIIFWSDSTITLQWLKRAPNTLKTFVANRVSEIQNITQGYAWRHVSSQDNPADHLSRGLMPVNLLKNRLWMQGPHWLRADEQQWPDFVLPEITDIPESKPLFIFINKTDEMNIINKFSSFTKLKRVVAYCLRWRRIVLKDTEIREHLSVKEIKEATIRIIKMVQREHFSEEILIYTNKQNLINRKSRLLTLCPFIDSDGILRVGGRLVHANISYDAKHPILLPAKHPITTLIIRHTHITNMHSGTQATLHFIRQQYWITDGRTTVRNVLLKCVTCLRAKPSEYHAIMAPLPKERITPSRPFLSAGVDFCGPFYIKEKLVRNRGRVKVYVAIFICFSTKAVHIELVSDVTSEAFIAALKRFFARRGKSTHLYSDNATNFIGANREIAEMYKLIKQTNSSIIDFSSNEGLEWHFIPPRAPHFGGLWEAAVKSVKHHLTRVIGEAILSYEALMTYLIEIEAILNSRPISPLSSDPNDFSALTPAHFLIGSSLKGIVEHNYTDVVTNRLSMWQHVTNMKQHFWIRWHKEYLHHLTVQNKWHTGKAPAARVGQLVLLREDNIPPMQWRLGRIIVVHPGKDGEIRVVTVKTAQGEYKRSIQKLAPLLASEDFH